jgi:3-hydroxymyristoyl/3-hydroxydecanoyl-(acyl carrier protein) dehydratase
MASKVPIDETVSETLQAIVRGVEDARETGCVIPDTTVEVNLKLTSEGGRPVTVTLPLALPVSRP